MAHDVCVNRPKVAAYRAPGAPMAALATENTINELASRLGMDPIDIRLKNAVMDGDQSPSGPKYGRIGLVDVLEKVKSHAHYSAPLGPNQGRGFALGYWMHGGGLSSVSAHLLDDGTVAVAVIVAQQERVAQLDHVRAELHARRFWQGVQVGHDRIGHVELGRR